MSYVFGILRASRICRSSNELHSRNASERLLLSQPALSKKIQRIEEKLKVALFVRSRRRVGLTMSPDNETELGFLNFTGVADTVAEIIVQAHGSRFRSGCQERGTSTSPR
jgi:hypothetical protein